MDDNKNIEVNFNNSSDTSSLQLNKKLNNQQLINQKIIEQHELNKKLNNQELHNLNHSSSISNFSLTEDILDIINFFSNIHEFNIAIQLTFEMLCNTYKFDRICFFIKSNTKFIKAYEHNISNSIDNYISDINLEKNMYLVDNDYKNIKQIESFFKVFGKQKYLYTTEFENIREDFENLQFDIINKDIKQFYSYYFSNNSHITGYMTLEKYSDIDFVDFINSTNYTNYTNSINSNSYEFKTSENNKKLNTCLKELNTINNLINRRAITTTNKNLLDKENKIYQSILNQDNTNTSIIVIKKSTYEILYFNNNFKIICPEVEIGSICYNLKSFDIPYDKLHLYNNIDSNINSNINSNKLNNMDYSLECTSITWNSGVDSYILNIKSNLETTLNTPDIDLLTKSPTLDKFKKDFNINIIPKINNNKLYALFLFDVEKFNYINYAHGYTVGDEILRKISYGIRNFIKLDELYCRVNEDKFAMLISYANDKDLNDKTIALNNVFNNIQNFYFDGMSIVIVCGIYKIEKEIEIKQILDKANIARKNAKGCTKSTYKIYDTTLQEYIEKQNFIEERAILGFKNNEFVPFLQAKFNINTNELCGAEALVRWQSFDRMIYPDEFIPIFEENGLMKDVDFVIYEKIFAYLGECIKNNKNLIPISLNVSKGHINDSNFANKIFDLLLKYGVPVSLVEMEIVENVFNENIENVKALIGNLRNLGIKVAIDDFGTSYSSLNTLKDIEVDVVKLDRGFLKNVEKVKDDANLLNKDKIIIKHIVEMCDDLNVSVLCEGIETLEQVSFLKSIGCEFGQGYIFSKPIAIPDFENEFFNHFGS